jgi:hypothetical protein
VIVDMDANVIIKTIRSNNQTGDTVWIATPHGRDMLSFLTHTFLLPCDYLSVVSLQFNKIGYLLVVYSILRKKEGMLLLRGNFVAF